MADASSIYDLPVADAVRELERDGIVTNNPDLEAATRTLTQSAPMRGIEDLNVIYFDSDPGKNTDLINYAREVLDKTGGTVIVRSPNEIAIASQDYPRAVLDNAQMEAMKAGGDYQLSLDQILNALQNYSVPWTVYSLVAGAVIIIAFVILIAYWWNKTPEAGEATTVHHE